MNWEQYFLMGMGWSVNRYRKHLMTDCLLSGECEQCAALHDSAWAEHQALYRPKYIEPLETK